MTTFRWGSAEDVGQVRQVNQDHLFTTDGLFVVADGMGGHRAGEVASELAVATFREHTDGSSVDQLVTAVQAANTAVVTQAQDNAEFRGMGTTLSAVARVRDTDGDGDLLAVVNVGDSRVYLLRAESQDLEQITDDHSLVETLRRQGQLTEEEAAVHPQRNILTRALGIDHDVLVDSWELLPVTGDRYLICSDGLFNEVAESKIAAVLRRLDDPDDAAAELVRLANEAGGKDNISVVILDVAEAETTVEGPGADRIVRVTHGEARSGSESIDEAIPARPAAVTAGATPAPEVTGGTDDLADAGSTTSAPAAPDAPPPAPPSPRSRLTWRVLVFMASFAVVLGGSVVVINWYATSTYYVGLQGGQVQLLQGRPGGVLWFDPETVRASTWDVDEVEELLPNEARLLRTDPPLYTDRASAEAAFDELIEELEALEVDAATEPSTPGSAMADALADTTVTTDTTVVESPTTTTTTATTAP
ncbi:MAG: Stp1/IreP family PP2C-type Ser/Thr phosphatase [Acidimicrobiia bacterium]|nr:Stp1/IreP family PP2C-type Ser/Thr phosphatase [Acidimicrobiia bacterium]